MLGDRYERRNARVTSVVQVGRVWDAACCGLDERHTRLWQRVTGWFKPAPSGGGWGGLRCRASVLRMGPWSLLGASVHVDTLVVLGLPLVGQAASSGVSRISQLAGGGRNAAAGSPVRWM